MISFQNISKHYGPQTIMKEADFIINTGDRVGIVGPNGAGKSTLFKLICQEITPDGGNITCPKHCRLGHLKQELSGYPETVTLLEYTMRSLSELQKIDEEIQRLEKKLAAPQKDQQEKRLNRLGQLMERFEYLGGHEMGTRAETALSGLGFHGR